MSTVEDEVGTSRGVAIQPGVRVCIGDPGAEATGEVVRPDNPVTVLIRRYILRRAASVDIVF